MNIQNNRMNNSTIFVYNKVEKLSLIEQVKNLLKTQDTNKVKEFMYGKNDEVCYNANLLQEFKNDLYVVRKIILTQLKQNNGDYIKYSKNILNELEENIFAHNPKYSYQYKNLLEQIVIKLPKNYYSSSMFSQKYTDSIIDFTYLATNDVDFSCGKTLSEFQTKELSKDQSGLIFSKKLGYYLAKGNISAIQFLINYSTDCIPNLNEILDKHFVKQNGLQKNALYKAINANHTQTVKKFITFLLNSNCTNETKKNILIGCAFDTETKKIGGLYEAIYENRIEIVEHFITEVIGSSITQEYQLEIFEKMNCNGLNWLSAINSRGWLIIETKVLNWGLNLDTGLKERFNTLHKKIDKRFITRIYDYPNDYDFTKIKKNLLLKINELLPNGYSIIDANRVFLSQKGQDMLKIFMPSINELREQENTVKQNLHELAKIIATARRTRHFGLKDDFTYLNYLVSNINSTFNDTSYSDKYRSFLINIATVLPKNQNKLFGDALPKNLAKFFKIINYDFENINYELVH